jgi:hypothetical protein
MTFGVEVNSPSAAEQDEKMTANIGQVHLGTVILFLVHTRLVWVVQWLLVL